MLVYHPAYDSYHCITRILKILKFLSTKEYNIDRIRIYDYYLLFPNDIESITLPKDFNNYKYLVLSNRYNKVENPSYVFSQLENVQNIALRAIASYGFINKDLFENDIIQLGEIDFPYELIPELNAIELKYMSFIDTYFEKITLRELKQRTKLMEYRYELS